MIYRSNIGRYLKINLPLWITQSHINLLCAIILEAKKAFQSNFPGSSFYVLFHPMGCDREKNQKVKERLNDMNIKFFYCKENIFYMIEKTGSVEIPHDGHPTGRANEEVAKFVVEKLSIGN